MFTKYENVSSHNGSKMSILRTYHIIIGSQERLSKLLMGANCSATERIANIEEQEKDLSEVFRIPF